MERWVVVDEHDEVRNLVLFASSEDVGPWAELALPPGWSVRPHTGEALTAHREETAPPLTLEEVAATVQALVFTIAEADPDIRTRLAEKVVAKQPWVIQVDHQNLEVPTKVIEDLLPPPEKEEQEEREPGRLPEG